MKLNKVLFSALLLCVFNVSNAQDDDLMKELDATSQTKQNTTAAFKGLQVCNMQSTKLPAKGEFYFLVSHRFGDLTNGINNFFGLDNAFTKIGGIYGATNWLSLGLSRHTYQKTFEFAAKYKFANQVDDGFPVTIVGYNTMDVRTDKLEILYPGIKFNNRLAYSTQLIVSRKFSKNFSMQVAPIFIHKNLYDGVMDQKNLILVGTGARYKIAKRLSLNFDYAARVNLPEGFTSPFRNPATIGLDIETGGHVFQLVFSNSQPMNDVSYYSTATGLTGGKNIFFGFNMYRAF